MHDSPPPAALLLSALALAVASAAQEAAGAPPTLPPSATLPSVCTPIHGQPDDEGQPYGIWAAGAGYKASFHGGMTFVPYVGRDAAAPTLAWRTVSARVGEQELATAAAPRLHHTEWRAEYDLGGVVEAYDVRAEGLEQTFVLARRPAAGGDLVIRGEVTTSLQALPFTGHGPVSFVDPAGRAMVCYGAALAIDADGDTCPLTTTTVAGGLELRLPGAWLATASFPLVVDPLLAPTTVGSGAEITEVTVAHDGGGTANVWYAEVRVSGTDHDLRLLRLDENGQNPVLVYSDLSSSWSSVEPSLGRNLPTQKVLLAYTRHVFATNVKRVRMHLHARADLTFQAQVFDMPNPAGENQWRPAVGNELSPISFTTVLVAYQVEGTGTFAQSASSAIHARDILCGAGGSAGNLIVVADASLTDYERPVVSSVSSGPTRWWTVAYQRYYSGAFGQEWDIALRRVGPNLLTSAQFLVDNGQTDRHEMAPRLDGRDDRLMLFCTASTAAESSLKPMGSNGHRIRGMRLDWDGAGFVTPHGSNDLQVNNDARLEIVGVGYDSHTDGHWLLAFRSNATQTVYCRTYGHRGLQLTADTVATPATALGTSVGGGVCFQGNASEFLIAYGMDEPGVGSYARLRRWQYPVLAGSWNTGTACTTTQLDWWGSARIGTEQCGVVFTNAPPNSLTACVVATGSASVQLFGVGGVHDGCWLLVPLAGPDYLGLLGPLLATASQYALPLPEGLPSMTLRFQALTLDTSSMEFFSSDRLHVPIGL